MRPLKNNFGLNVYRKYAKRKPVLYSRQFWLSQAAAPKIAVLQLQQSTYKICVTYTLYID